MKRNAEGYGAKASLPLGLYGRVAIPSRACLLTPTPIPRWCLTDSNFELADNSGVGKPDQKTWV